MTFEDRKYLITGIRDRAGNEFIFECSERMAASNEFDRLLNFFIDQGWDIARMDPRSLPKDASGNSMIEYRITEREKGKDD